VDFGVVLQTDPPASRVIELARMAEGLGFSHGWTFDSHVLWQEPFVIYSQMLAATEEMVVGPMVTNPGTRDWTVLASLFATLNDMYGERTICGMGRGDSALRYIGRKPTTLSTMVEAMGVIKGLVAGEEVDYNDQKLAIPWIEEGWDLPIWVAGYGPKALDTVGRHADGYILQLADPQVLEWTVAAVREAAVDEGRDPEEIAICVVAPAYVGDDLGHQREQLRWFGGMVGNHVADMVRRYGEDQSKVPHALSDYIRGREGYDYDHHGKAGSPSTDFVPDEIVDRFCVLGPAEAHIEKLSLLRDMGVDHFGVYLMHDDQEGTLQDYGEKVIPAINR
jgi:probable F420-dependent oxidoreductase